MCDIRILSKERARATSSRQQGKEILFKSGTGFNVDNVAFSPNPDDFMTPIRTIWLQEL